MLKLPYFRYYKKPSNIRPPWIEDGPKALKILEKKRVLGLEEWPKGLKNKYKTAL